MLAAEAGRRKPAWSLWRTRLTSLPGWLYPLGLALAALGLRAVPYAAAYPLHRDEAIYGVWAQAIANGQDPFLLAAWVDKPPLVLYLLAASLSAFGITDLALRLPGMLAGVALVPVLYGLARATWRPPSGHWQYWLP